MSNPEYQNLLLNNGTVATYVGHDFWSRPLYEFEYKGIKHRVCCVEFDGSTLHTMDADWEEPIAPLREEFQMKEKIDGTE